MPSREVFNVTCTSSLYFGSEGRASSGLETLTRRLARCSSPADMTAVSVVGFFMKEAPRRNFSHGIRLLWKPQWYERFLPPTPRGTLSVRQPFQESYQYPSLLVAHRDEFDAHPATRHAAPYNGARTN